VVTTTASEKPAPAEGAKSPERTFWRRLTTALLFWRRLPTPLLVTLLGIALSAWLLPAVTRQWDDRQKARDLQASLIGEMSTASARALGAGFNAIETRQSRSGRLRKAEQDWEIAGLEVEAKLRAYFPQRVVKSWVNVREFIFLAMWAAFHREVVLPDGPGGSALIKLRKALGNGKSKFNAYDSRSKAVTAWNRYVQFEIINLESKAEGAVLASHPRGYSTTFGDFLHDIVP
jgi:hypothetical protein